MAALATCAVPLNLDSYRSVHTCAFEPLMLPFTVRQHVVRRNVERERTSELESGREIVYLRERVSERVSE